MTKKLICLLLAAVMLITVTACGTVKQDSKAETETYYNYDLSGFFKLGKYKDIKVTAFDTEPTDEEIEEMMQSYMDSDSFFKVVDRAAKKEDRVTIDYVGKLDGEAFEGGTAEDAKIILGNSGYIDGFDDAIVGMKKGETKDANLTFPEDYNNPNLKGQDTVFTITLKEVEEAVPSELTDKFLAEYSDMFDTVDELRDYCKDTIKSRKESQLSYQNNQACLEAIRETSEYLGDLPKADLDRNLSTITEQIQNTFMQYLMYGYFDGTIEEFIKASTGKDCEKADDYFKEASISQTRDELILASIAKAEKISVTDEEYKELTGKYKDYGSESEEAFVEDNGGEAYLKWYLLQNKVLDFILENVTFVDKDGNKVDYPAPTEVPDAE